MSKTARELTQGELEEYREAYRERAVEEERARQERERRARELARQAADLLGRRFGATRVVLFGSLAGGHFTLWSDVDVAAWGIKPQDTLAALGAVQDLSDEIAVSFVDVGACRAPILASIEAEGVEL
ncbi:MAG: nucleotidyltransferase domain-containing protein [Anaerolineae bacterium]|nr:nucleotidyltransferase domain-containing protein [Anaerolineae bacterium]